MVQQTVQQLDLPTTMAEAAQLTQEITRLHGILDALVEDRDQAQDELGSMKTTLTEAQAEIMQLKKALTLAQLRDSAVSTLSQRHVPAAGDMVPKAIIDSELRRLLALAHPDKWAQEQSATALAHEVASAINGLRARLGEGAR